MTNAGRHGALRQVLQRDWRELRAASGLTTTSISGRAPADPIVALVDDSPRPPSQQFHIDANTWHRLTFTLELDHKELDGHTNLLPPWGGMTRVIWREANNNGGALTQTSGIIVLDGGPNTYTIDMAALQTFCGADGWTRAELRHGRIAGGRDTDVGWTDGRVPHRPARGTERRARSGSRTSGWPPTTPPTATASSRFAGRSPMRRSRARWRAAPGAMRP